MKLSLCRSLPLVLTLVLCLSSCDSTSEDQEGAGPEVVSFAGKTVTLLIPADEAEYFRWEIVLREWEAQTQGKTAIVPYENTEQLLETLQDEAKRTNTIAFFPRQQFAEIGRARVLAAIPETMQGPEDFNWRDLYDSLRKSALNWDGQPTVLPVREPILLLYYRADLLEAAGLKPPADWQDYRKLLSQLDQWAPGLSAVEPWNAGFRSYMFLTHALPYAHTSGNYSVFFDYSNGQPLIDTPGFVRGIEQAREILPLLDPHTTEMSPEDCLDAIRGGRAALAIAPAFPVPDLAGESTEDEGQEHHFPIGAAPVPGASTVFDAGRDTWRDLNNQVNRTALSGWEGLFVGVAKSPGHGDAVAWNLLRSLMTANAEDYASHVRDHFAPGVMTSTRLSTERQNWSPEFESFDVESHVEAVRESLRDSQLVPALTIAHRDEFLGGLNETVSRLICEEPNADAQAGLSELASRWSALMEEYGLDEMRLSYARTLGVRVTR